MFVFVLLLLLISAILGILGAVLKFAFTLVLGLMLAGAIVAAIIAWWMRRTFAWARAEKPRLPDR